MKNRVHAHIVIFIASIICTSATAGELRCHVVGISDGDTITALCSGSQRVKVRLAEIDAPEKAQPFGARSKQSLSDLCFGKEARINDRGRDRYGRTIGRIYCITPGVNVEIDASAEQVNRGMAWVYDRYVTDRTIYAIQDDARASRRGLWADGYHTPPWEWRKAKR